MTHTTDKPKPSNPSLADLALLLGVTEQDILSHCRKAELVDARSFIVAFMLKHLGLRQQDVAGLLDISQAAVSKLMARHQLFMEQTYYYADYARRFSQFEQDIMEYDKKPVY